ncbi:CaiB/BaiF CoA-transferase family protein [Sporosarcina sp. 179-K 3D1 HS]|uniref:CaiB/BaiF CoA transferase family protein n=1 Tax=Sporosarcina sp. 179-K 3D1 HS TaxID=3232169 RepID=UPI0039A160EF
MKPHPNGGPLSGIRIVELGQIAAGPFAGMLLADLGADVVKIERPDGGDGMRSWPPLLKNENGEVFSGNFASLNRNKRSVTVDFTNESEVRDLRKMIANADVLIENYRPGILKKFNLDYESLREVNPKLVYCSISGFGQQGPYSKKGAFDVTIQAMSGLMSVTGEDGGPAVKAGVPVGDFVTALYGAYCILAGLSNVNRTNEGTYIDCSMLGSLLGISALQTSEYYGTGRSPKALGSAHPRNAPYQGFYAMDKPFVIAAGNDKLWNSVCMVVGKPDLVYDERFITQEKRADNQKELANILQPIFRTATSAVWLEQLDKEGVPCAPINTFEEILKDPHVVEMDWIKEVQLPNGTMTKDIGFPVGLSNFNFQIYRNAPRLGEHNREVFEEWLGVKQNN